MHWTALLARHRFSRDAQVIDDLPCAGCGYNLRGLSAAGSCPECGRFVGDSLYMLQNPEGVASGLRTCGRTWFGQLGLLVFIAGVAIGSTGGIWIGLGLLFTATLIRLVGVTELRFTAGLSPLPYVGHDVAFLFIASVLELIVGFATVVLLYLSLNVTAATWLPDALKAAGLLWVIATLASATLTAGFGMHLAKVLEWDFVEREFRIERFLIYVGLGLSLVVLFVALLVIVVTGHTVAGQVVGVFGLGIMLLTWFAAVGFMTVGLLHLAGAAERERDQREDVIATVPGNAPTASPAAKEPPPISLE